MSNVSIKVESLGKRYRIGVRDEIPDTFGTAIAKTLTQPLRNFRKLRRLSNFADSGEAASDVIWALRDVSFEVEQGALAGVIGLNGSGKTTLLKILSRITEPTEGSAVIHGRVSSLLEVGTGFHPELTGRENVYLNGTILGMRRKEIDRKFDEIVDFSGVERFIDTPVKRYSTGMSVRLAFAVAAHLEPETLLVDEVLAVGDISFQQKCLAKMGDIARGGATVLFVSHNMGTVSTLCNTVILLKDGQLDKIGPTRQIISDYLESASTDGGQSREWSYEDAPTCSQGKVKSINITNEAGVQDPYLPCSEPVVVNIEYWITNNEGLPVNIGIWLFDSQGQSICSTGNIENARARTETKPGLYRSSCTIPGGLLNGGRHGITVGLYSDVSLNPLNGTRQLVLDVPQCVSFETVDDDRFQTNYDNWPGVIKPRFPWETTFTLDAEPIPVGD